MNNYLLKYIRGLKKNKKIPKEIPVLIIIILLLIQIIVTYIVCKKNNISSYNNFVARIISYQIANEESRRDNLSAVAAAIASDGKVLNIAEKKDPTYLELAEPCANIRKLIAASSGVSNIFMYNEQYGYIYDAYGKLYNASEKSAGIVRKLSTGISRYHEKGEMFFMFSEEDQDNPQSISYFEIFNFASGRKDLIIIEDNTNLIFREYQKIREVVKSDFIVTTFDGEVIYGGGKFKGRENISNTAIFKAVQNKKTYDTVNFDSEKYILTHFYSDKTKHNYIAIIPTKKVKVGFLYGENYLSLYICITISLLILLGTLSIWRRFYRLFVEHSLTDFEKKNNRQNISVYSEYGTPSEKGNKNLEDYLYSRFNEVFFVAVLMVIDNYKELEERYSSADLTLIKYGLGNIFTEIFDSCDIKFLQASDTKEKIEIILAPEAKKRIDDIKEALLKCQKSFDEYIGIISSFYIGSPETKNNFYKSYSISANLSSYSFVYGPGIIVDETSATMMNDSDFNDIKVLCDKIKEDIDYDSAEYMSDMSKLKESLALTSPSQCYEILCYLLFNICSIIKNIERKYSVDGMLDIGTSFKTLTSARYSTEVLSSIELLYCDIRSILPDKSNTKYEKLVEDCNNIIETNYSDQNLSVDSIADKLGFSKGHLTRVYKQNTGISIVSKISDTRLDMAATLLVETDKKIFDILNEVGFVNSSHFTVIFKQRFGVSPLNYRRQYRHKDKKET